MLAVKASGKVSRILLGILDRHTSRKNALYFGDGPVCDCEDCQNIRKALKVYLAEHYDA